MADLRSDRVALVTGAGSGMGAACGRRFARDHAAVVLLDDRPMSLATISEDVERAGSEALALYVDVTNASDVGDAIRTASSRFDRLDVVVNAAGILEPTRFMDISLGEWRRILEVNLTGAFLVTRSAVAPMRERGWGRIVHFSSSAGKTVSTLGGAHYTASKHGVLGLVRAAAKELAPFGITVNAVCPGLIDTEMVRATTTREQRAAYARGFPVARLGTPEEVAEIVAFIASDAAGYVTGAALDVNGGDLMI
jgi:3-oxoacyl-[acyl-carrier protein] reductase